MPDRPAPITTNPAVLLGKPVIRGTRIAVELLARKVSQGASVAEGLRMYAQLQESEVRAALALHGREI